MCFAHLMNDGLTALGDMNQWINIRHSHTEGQTAGISLDLQKASVIKRKRKNCNKSKDIKGICSRGQVENTRNKTCPINDKFSGFDTCTIIKALGRQRRADLCEFVTRLIYIVISRTAKAT